MNGWCRTASALIVFMVFVSSARAAAPVRVALMMAQPGRDAEKSLLLAECELSNDADIVMLDRQHIGLVLWEQRLDAQGLSASDQVLQLGRLLTAELLVVVEPDSRDGSGAGGLVVYHASTGLRLWDAALSGGGIEESAQGICQAVRSAIRKLQAEDRGAVSVCILHLRNAELPSHWGSRIQTLGKLLERHLVRMPNVAVLERQHLEFASSERRLPSGEPIAPLLASQRFLSIDAERPEDGRGVAVAVRVSNGAHKDLAMVTITDVDGDVAELAKRLAEAIAEKLGKDASGSRLDRKAEARRFTHAGNVEAAYALDPNGPLYRIRYMSVLSGRTHAGIPHFDPGLLQAIHRLPFKEEALEISLGYAQQVLDLMCEEVGHQIASPDWPRTFHSAPAGGLSGWLRKVLPVVGLLSAEKRQKLYEFVCQYREFQERWGKELLTAAGTKGALSEFNQWALHYLVDVQYIQVFMEEADDWPFTEWTDRWIGLLDCNSLEADEQHLPEAARILSLLWYQQKNGALTWNNRTEQLRSGYDRIASARSRLFRLYGRMFLVELDRESVRDPESRRPSFINRPPVDKSIERRIEALIAEAVQETIRSDITHVIRKAWTDLLDHLVTGLSAEARPRVVEAVVEELWANDVYGGRLPLALMREQRHAKDYDTAVQTIDRALAMLEGRRTGMDSLDCREEIDRLVEQRKVLREQADRDARNRAPWRSVKTLFECVAPEKCSGIRYKEEAFRAIARPVVAGSDVYFLAFRFSGARDHANLVLMRCSLDGGTANELGGFRVRRRYLYEKAPPDEPRRVLENCSPVIDSPAGSSSIVDAVVAHGRYYAATQGYGILVFPLDGSEPWAIDESDGIPLNQVQRVAVYGDDIYSWVGRDGRNGSSHSYLVRISRAGKVAEVICSSQRSKPKNILDGHRPTVCYFMALDGAKERLVFGLNSGGCLECRAIFQFDLPTQTFSKLVDCARNMSFHTGHHYGNSILMWGSQSPVGPGGAPRSGMCTPVLLSFDLTTDALTEVLSDDLRVGSPKIILVEDKHFWTSCPFGRIDRETGEFEPLPPLRPWEFGILTTAIRLDEERVLLLDSQSLWLMVLPKETPE